MRPLLRCRRRGSRKPCARLAPSVSSARAMTSGLVARKFVGAMASTYWRVMNSRRLLVGGRAAAQCCASSRQVRAAEQVGLRQQREVRLIVPCAAGEAPVAGGIGDDFGQRIPGRRAASRAQPARGPPTAADSARRAPPAPSRHPPLRGAHPARRSRRRARALQAASTIASTACRCRPRRLQGRVLRARVTSSERKRKKEPMVTGARAGRNVALRGVSAAAARARSAMTPTPSAMSANWRTVSSGSGDDAGSE